MSVLSVIKDVCAVVGVTIPTSVFANLTGNRTMQEMLSLANEMAQRIAYDTRDWTRLKKTTHHFAGSGVAVDPDNPLAIGCEVFNFPEDFKRLLLTANVWRSTQTLTPMTFIPDADQWMNRRVGNRTSSGEWTVIGGQIYVSPMLAPGEVAYYAYLDKNCVTLPSGGFGDAFQNDADTFRLNERVLKLAMIWQWKAQKGSPYAEDMGTYGDALTTEMGHDSPAPILISVKRSGGWSANVQY